MILSKKSFFALFIALSCFLFMNSQAGVAVSGDEDVVAGVLGAKIDIYLSRVTRSGLAGKVPKIKELIDLRWPVEVALSPDGNAVAFGVEVANWEKNRYDREIWVSREGREPVAFVKDQSSNYGLKWSPDGLTLFFLSDRTGKPQVHSVSLDGGEAQALTNVEQGVNSFDVSPAAARARIFAPYQVNARLMAHAKKDALFMHCLPAHRGEEVTNEVIDSPNSVVYDEAENRLHAQNSILIALMGS